MLYKFWIIFYYYNFPCVLYIHRESSIHFYITTFPVFYLYMDIFIYRALKTCLHHNFSCALSTQVCTCIYNAIWSCREQQSDVKSSLSTSVVIQHNIINPQGQLQVVLIHKLHRVHKNVEIVSLTHTHCIYTQWNLEVFCFTLVIVNFGFHRFFFPWKICLSFHQLSWISLECPHDLATNFAKTKGNPHVLLLNMALFLIVLASPCMSNQTTQCFPVLLCFFFNCVAWSVTSYFFIFVVGSWSQNLRGCHLTLSLGWTLLDLLFGAED